MTATIIGGVDTHKDIHCAAAITDTGAMLGSKEFPATAAGYQALTRWLASHGTISTVGVEGSGSYGAGLARHCQREGLTVVEVPRPNRQLRRTRGKSDPIDAEAAARAALAGTATTAPKHQDGPIEAIRALHVARNTANKARTASIAAMKALITTAPDSIRGLFPSHATGMQVINIASRFRPDLARLHDPVQATKHALKTMAVRARALTEETRALKRQLQALLEQAAPATSSIFALGPETTAALLVTIGDNPDRLRSEAAFARLCGVAPIPASSGKTNRHRLHRGGHRQANSALHVAVVVRMRYCARTQEYVQRRTQEGKTKPEIIRCLKRYLAREVFQALRTDYSALHST